MASHKLQLQFLLILLAGALLLTFFVLKPFLTPLALAAICAVVLHTLYGKILLRVGNREAIAAWVTVLLSVVCILIPLAFLGTQIFQESAQLYGSLTEGDGRQNLVATAMQSAGRTSESIFPGTGDFFTNLSDNLDSYVKQGLAWLIQNLGSAISGISVLLLNLFIFFISFYYLLRDGPKLKRALIELSPLNDRDDRIVFGRLRLAVNSVIKGSLMIALIQGVLTAIGFSIFGIYSPLLFAASMAILGIPFSLVLLIV